MFWNQMQNSPLCSSYVTINWLFLSRNIFFLSTKPNIFKYTLVLLEALAKEFLPSDVKVGIYHCFCLQRQAKLLLAGYKLTNISYMKVVVTWLFVPSFMTVLPGACSVLSDISTASSDGCNSSLLPCLDIRFAGWSGSLLRTVSSISTSLSCNINHPLSKRIKPNIILYSFRRCLIIFYVKYNSWIRINSEFRK